MAGTIPSARPGNVIDWRILSQAETGSDLVRINVLGPVEVIRDGTAIRLADRQRALLAALAVEYDRVVPVDRLIGVLWDGTPPATARTKLQAHVSALRQAIGQPARQESGPLVTFAAGYLLSGQETEIDLAEFDAAMASARSTHESGHPAVGSELFARALALWRGPPFADVTAPALRAAAAPLEERRVLAVEAKAEADLSVGHCGTVAAELPPWLHRLPLRERLRGLLMIALYRLGCRAEALRLYREGRQVMISELGLEPGAHLQALHRHILADAGAVRPIAVPRRPAPAAAEAQPGKR
jgi:DNA-binding SARP family transcriptional activator